MCISKLPLSKGKLDYWQRSIGIPLDEIPIGIGCQVLVNHWGLRKVRCQVVRVVLMEDHTYPYIEILDPRHGPGPFKLRSINLRDFGRLWANREDQFEAGW